MYKKFRRNSAEKCNDAEVVKEKPQGTTITTSTRKRTRQDTREQDPTIQRHYVYRALDIETFLVK